MEDELFYEGDRRRPYLYRFFTLLIFSTFIAIFGLLSNSSAVVIAAMIVAPLMTPILGYAGGMVTGRPKFQVESVLLVIVATGVITLLAVIVALIVPEPAVIPGQILDRTSPKIIDLGIALAAGGAGAYSIVRREASSALAGVAIGVSLVPPLSSFGILLAWSETDLASGALLLYVTNLAAIIFSGAIVFSVMGFLPISQISHLTPRIRIGLATAALAILIVAYPLYRHSQAVIEDGSTEETVSDLVNDALEDTEFELFDYSVDGDTITLSIVGPVNATENAPPESEEVRALANDLANELDEPVALIVRVFPYNQFSSNATPNGSADAQD